MVTYLLSVVSAILTLTIYGILGLLTDQDEDEDVRRFLLVETIVFIPCIIALFFTNTRFIAMMCHIALATWGAITLYGMSDCAKTCPGYPTEAGDTCDSYTCPDYIISTSVTYVFASFGIAVITIRFEMSME
jgi:hypothetical protein